MLGLKIPHMMCTDRLWQVVLNNFSLSIPSGKTVALCGLSGEGCFRLLQILIYFSYVVFYGISGKSTVAALLERFYDVDNGSVLVDGRDICDLDLKWLRGQVVGFINQVHMTD